MAAAADVPAPKGYVERCTLEKQQRPGDECVACSTYYAEADACEKQHSPRGFARRCKTRGASTWSEIWCKESAGPKVASTGDPQDAGAGTDPQPSASASATATTAPSAAPTAIATPATGDPSPVEPTPAASSAPQPTTRPAPGERGGGCGACQLGAPAGAREVAWLGVVALVALRRRRRRFR